MTKKEENAMVSWEEKMAAEAKEVTAVERPSSNFISLRGGQMTLNDNPFPDNALNAVILASMYENAYYPDKFDPNNIVNPVCFTLGYSDDTLVPHENASKPQHETCMGCPHGEWGSAESGKGKACRQSRRLMVMAADEGSLKDIPNADMAVIRLPVTSVKNWANYVNRIAGAVKRAPWYVVTNVNTRPDTRTQFKVNFDFIEAIPDTDTLSALETKHQEALVALNTPYSKTENKEEEDTGTEKF